MREVIDHAADLLENQVVPPRWFVFHINEPEEMIWRGRMIQFKNGRLVSDTDHLTDADKSFFNASKDYMVWEGSLKDPELFSTLYSQVVTMVGRKAGSSDIPRILDEVNFFMAVTLSDGELPDIKHDMSTAMRALASALPEEQRRTAHLIGVQHEGPGEGDATAIERGAAEAEAAERETPLPDGFSPPPMTDTMVHEGDGAAPEFS
jgi:hypothetical protein